MARQASPFGPGALLLLLLLHALLGTVAGVQALHRGLLRNEPRTDVPGGLAHPTRRTLLADSDSSAEDSDQVTAAPSPPVIYSMLPRHVKPGQVFAPPNPPLHLPPRTPFAPNKYARPTPTEAPEPDSDGGTRSPTVEAPTVHVDTEYTFAGGFSIGSSVEPKASTAWTSASRAVLLLGGVAAAVGVLTFARAQHARLRTAVKRAGAEAAAEVEPLRASTLPPTYGASSVSTPL